MIRALFPTALLLLAGVAQADPLPSWNDTATKTAIIDFVEGVTTPGSETFLPEADRIAVFDNDGTLWAEQPMYFQLFFALDAIRLRGEADPAFLSTDVLKAAAAGDLKTILSGGKAALAEVVMASHTDMTSEAFQAAVADWAATAVHPQTGLRFADMTYQPMTELLRYLRDEGFSTWIVTGGGTQFVRAIAEDAYGIPPEQVVGSLVDSEYRVVDGLGQIWKLPDLAFIDDKGGKPVGIDRNIGKRPVLAFGNSDGDYEMLEYTTTGPGPSLGLILHHTDATREYAYDREGHIGNLARGLDDAKAQGWILVDMATDWSRIYSGGTVKAE
jgi:phosphoglycolate phosphatase-like HAD superfamily hydrolase